jgi:DNA-directed RNA polymerase specialized sigma24 family protein
MHSVDADRMLAAAVAGDDSAWGSIVDSNVDRLWHSVMAEGLSEPDAAQVCELAWLRLSQRLHTFASLDDVSRWLDVTIRREAAGLVAQRAERARFAPLPDNVVPLRPGSAVACAEVVPGERTEARQFSVRQVVAAPRRRSDVSAEPADTSSAAPV